MPVPPSAAPMAAWTTLTLRTGSIRTRLLRSPLRPPKDHASVDGQYECVERGEAVHDSFISRKTGLRRAPVLFGEVGVHIIGVVTTSVTQTEEKP